MQLAPADWASLAVSAAPGGYSVCNPSKKRLQRPRRSRRRLDVALVGNLLRHQRRQLDDASALEQASVEHGEGEATEVVEFEDGAREAEGALGGDIDAVTDTREESDCFLACYQAVNRPLGRRECFQLF